MEVSQTLWFSPDLGPNAADVTPPQRAAAPRVRHVFQVTLRLCRPLVRCVLQGSSSAPRRMLAESSASAEYTPYNLVLQVTMQRQTLSKRVWLASWCLRSSRRQVQNPRPTPWTFAPAQDNCVDIAACRPISSRYHWQLRCGLLRQVVLLQTGRILVARTRTFERLPTTRKRPSSSNVAIHTARYSLSPSRPLKAKLLG